MPFPSPPWQLQAQSWLSAFVVRDSRRADRPPGVYAVALVDYREGSVLTYHELLVARVLREGRRVRVTDIWVDSVESMAGGRALWAIPKQLGDLPLRTEARGPAARTSFSCRAEGAGVATGVFTSTPRAALLPLPFASATSQTREDGTELVTRFAGRARPVPCHARWRFEADGPLGWLAGRRPVGSLHVVDAGLTFGG